MQINKAIQVWIPLYRVEKVLTNSNYIVRKVGTNFTQCVHRIRLRPVKQPADLQDLEAIDPQQFVPDPSRRDDKREPELFDRHVEDLIFPQPKQQAKVPNEQPGPQIRLSIPLGGAPFAAPPPAPIVPPIPPPPPENTGGHPRPNNDSSSEEDQEAENLVQPTTIISNPVVGPPSSNDEPSRVVEQHQTRRQSQRIRNQHHLNQQALTTQTPRRVSFSTQVSRRRYSPSAKAATRPYQPPGSTQASSSAPTLTRDQKHAAITQSAQRSKESGKPTRETKLDQVRSSILRNQQGSSLPSYMQETTSSRNRRSKSPELNKLQSKRQATVIQIKGNIHNIQTPLAHCVSSTNAKYNKLQSVIRRKHPYAQIKPINHLKLPIGSVLTNFDPEHHKFFFTLVTKNSPHDTASYYALSLALETLKTTMQYYNIFELVLPKVGKGLDCLRERTVIRLIFDKFKNTPITIYYQN